MYWNRLVTGARMAVVLAVTTMAASNPLHAQASPLGLPSIQEVKQAFQAGDGLQTVGTQCIALAEVLRMVPEGLRESQPAEWQRVRDAYASEIAKLRNAIGGAGLAGSPSLKERSRWLAACTSSENYMDASPRTAAPQGRGLPMPSYSQIKGVLKGDALAAVNAWENGLHSEGRGDSKPSEFSRMLGDMGGLATKLLGLPVVLLGIGGFIFVGRRQFNRRNRAGVEMFSSYGEAVGNKMLEAIVGLVSLGLFLGGAALLIFF